MAVRREQVVKTAEKLVARGKIDAAIKEYRKVLRDQPNDINTLNRVGDLYARDGRPDDAVKLFTQIAEEYTADGFFVKAIAIYKKINKIDPNRLEVYEKLAELYHRQGLVNEARGQYLVVAEWYSKHGNRASALSIYERLVELEPDDPSHRAKLAELYQEQQLTDKAIAQYGSIAELMIEHGRPGEAAKVYERALDVDASDLGFITGAVLSLREAGGTAAAAHLLAVAVEKNPEAASVARLAHVEAPAPAARGAAAATAPPGKRPAAAPVEEAPAAAVEEPPEVDLDEEDAEDLQAAADLAGLEAEIETEADAEAETDDADLVLDLDLAELAEELPFAAPGGPAAPDAPPPRSATQPAPQPPPRAAAPIPETPAPAAPADGETGEFELDLDDSFVLDLDDEEAPASLVQPPADLEDGPPLAFRPGSGPPFSAGPAAPPPAAPPEVEPPVLDDGVFVLDEEAAAEVAAPRRPPAPPPVPAPPAAPAAPAADERPPIDTDFLERTAAELLPPERQAEDLLTEAEVLAKYGLEAKATERLHEVLRLAPGHPEALGLLIRLDLERGQHARVVALANQLARRSAESGDDRVWRKVRRRLAEAGYRLDGDRVAAAPPEGLETEQAVGRMLEGLLDGEPAAPGRRRRAGGEQRVEAALAELEAGVRAPRAAPGPAAASGAGPGAVEEPPSEELPAGEERSEPPAEEPVEALSEVGPALGEPTAEAAPAEAAPAEPLEDSGTRWLADVEAATASLGSGDAALEEEEGFFDLAAEIEQELDAEEAREELTAMPREQTLEEIVEGFKQGVAESLSPEDFDTHFNLGIAYREMGLLDEAIGEFQLAAKDPGRLVECCSMLGLCFLDKGLPELAVKWYRRGLASPALTEDDQLGLLYDLGNVHLATGDLDQARSMFVEIYGTNSNYRDIVAKLEEIAAHYER